MGRWVCLAVTQRLALPAFDHLIIACFLSLFSPLLADDFTFTLFVAKCSVVFHYSRLYFPGFISDIIPPLCLLTRRIERSLQVQIPYVHCLLAWFTIYIVLFVFSPCFYGAWSERAVRNWGMGNVWHQRTVPCQSSVCWSSVSRLGRQLMMVNAFTMNMNASTKCLWNSMAGSTCDLGSFSLSVAMESHMLNAF